MPRWPSLCHRFLLFNNINKGDFLGWMPRWPGLYHRLLLFKNINRGESPGPQTNIFRSLDTFLSEADILHRIYKESVSFLVKKTIYEVR